MMSELVQAAKANENPEVSAAMEKEFRDYQFSFVPAQQQQMLQQQQQQKQQQQQPPTNTVINESKVDTGSKQNTIAWPDINYIM